MLEKNDYMQLLAEFYFVTNMSACLICIRKFDSYFVIKRVCNHNDEQASFGAKFSSKVTNVKSDISVCRFKKFIHCCNTRTVYM